MLRLMLCTAFVLATAPLAAQQGMAHDTAMGHGAAMGHDMAMGHGAFMKGETAVTGGYTIGMANDHSTLMLTGDFTLGKAPTPFVILSTTKGLDENPVWLGEVKTTGAQTFEIPAGTDLSHYKYVVIWCKSKKATLATAELPHGSMGGM